MTVDTIAVEWYSKVTKHFIVHLENGSVMETTFSLMGHAWQVKII